MKYAVVSDIHGNIFALEAVLNDARKCGTELYLFLGDYFNDFPFHNEATELIRSVTPSVVIAGNKEQRLAYAKSAAHWADNLRRP